MRAEARIQAAGRVLALGAALAISSCSDSGPDTPYLEFAGGGFIFNYRLATADYGFVVKVVRPIPRGAVLEARFEDPAGGPPIVLSQTAARGRLSYVFRTPPLQGVERGRDYRVELRLLEPGSGRVLARYARAFHSDVGQEVLPPTAPVVGPGYQRAAPPVVPAGGGPEGALSSRGNPPPPPRSGSAPGARSPP